MTILISGNAKIGPNYEAIQKTLKERFNLDDPKYNEAFKMLINESTPNWAKEKLQIEKKERE